MLVQRERNLQPTDEHECRDIFTTVGHLGKLVLKVADVRLETVTGSHFDSEEVVVVLLVILAGDILGENISVMFSKLWSECRTESRTNLRLHLSDWMERPST